MIDLGEKLFFGPLVFLHVQRDRVETAHIFTINNPLAFDRIGNDHHGSFFFITGLFERVEGVDDGIEIVAVYHLHIPVEGPELLIKRIQRVDVIRAPIYLKAVVINDTAHIIQFLIWNSQASLPDHAFLKVPIAHHGIDIVVVPIHFCMEGHSRCCGETMSQRARTEVNPFGPIFHGLAILLYDPVHGRVPLKGRIYLSVDLEQVLAEKTGLRQSGIQGGRCMSLAQDKAIPVGPEGIRGIIPHDVLPNARMGIIGLSKIKDGQDI